MYLGYFLGLVTLKSYLVLFALKFWHTLEIKIYPVSEVVLKPVSSKKT